MIKVNEETPGPSPAYDVKFIILNVWTVYDLITYIL